MTGKDLFKAINNLDDELIADAYVIEKKNARPRVLIFRYAAAAAVIALSVLTAVMLGKNRLPVTPAGTAVLTSAAPTTADGAETSPSVADTDGSETSESQPPQSAAAPSASDSPAPATAVPTVSAPDAVPAGEPTATAPTTRPAEIPAADTTASPTTAQAKPIPPASEKPSSVSPTRPTETIPSSVAPTVVTEADPSVAPSGIIWPGDAPQNDPPTAAPTMEPEPPTEQPAEETVTPGVPPLPTSDYMGEPIPSTDPVTEAPSYVPQNGDTAVFGGRTYRLQPNYGVTPDMVGDPIGRTADGRQVFACLTDGSVILVLTENGLRAFG